MEKLVLNLLAHSSPSCFNVDVAIVVALDKVELQAVLNSQYSWEDLKLPGDTSQYFITTVQNVNGRQLKVLATSTSRMGVAAAASMTMKVCCKFGPSLLIMTGIAAGIEGKCNFGDLLVADNCWEWDVGKLVEGPSQESTVLKPSPHQIPIDEGIRQFFVDVSRTREYLDDIYNGWTGVKPEYALKLHLGPLATGSSVIADKNVVSKIVEQNRGVIGIDMEGYGFLYSVVAHPSKSSSKALVIKSACDFANNEKNDSWQNYCAYTSTSMAFRYIENCNWTS